MFEKYFLISTVVAVYIPGPEILLALAPYPRYEAKSSTVIHEQCNTKISLLGLSHFRPYVASTFERYASPKLP